MNRPDSDIILERMMSLHPKVIDLTLDRMWRLLDALGNPHERLPPVVHIAGTNGKGSVLAMLRTGLEGSGMRVHAYTSPHLVRFHERIRLAGELISEDLLAETLDECAAANGGESITYFEITTCAAFLAFSNVAADFTLLETGLGGRLDATNVIDHPTLTVITPISLDHQQYLGDTLDQIAFEKAGILKPDVPCAVGYQEAGALEVIERRAERVGSPILVRGRHWQEWREHGRLAFQHEGGLLDLPLPALKGAHQIENAGLCLASLLALGFGESTCEAALRNVFWPARMQRLTSGPLVRSAPHAEIFLDGGHNPAAGHALANLLEDLPPKPLHLVAGMLRTKDIRGFLRPFAGLAQSLHGVSIPGQSATVTAQETAEAARTEGIAAESAESVEAAVWAVTSTDANARILICGSLYLAGEVLRENR